MKKFYKEHLEYVQNFWKSSLTFGDCVIDATLGNGHDCLFLSKQILSDSQGILFGYDIQQQALENTKLRLSKNLNASQLTKVKLFHKSHESFHDVKEEKITLINYNLGYLPGSDKTILTTPKTTIKSLKNALQLNPRHISITCYSGHKVGKIEENKVLEFVKSLSKDQWTVSLKQWINRDFFPSVLFLNNVIN